jgi:hypothetical protein
VAIAVIPLGAARHGSYFDETNTELLGEIPEQIGELVGRDENTNHRRFALIVFY